MDSRCLISVVPYVVALSYPHFFCSVIDTVCSNYIADPGLPDDDVKLFDILHCAAPRKCVAVVLQFQFQVHMLPSFNAVSYLVIRHLHDHPAAVSLFEYRTFCF